MVKSLTLQKLAIWFTCIFHENTPELDFGFITEKKRLGKTFDNKQLWQNIS